MPGFTGATGLTSTAENQNGCVQIVARGLDSEVRTNVQSAVSAPWGETITLGGFMSTSSTMIRMPDSTLAVFAIDEAGGLWTRRQIGANGPTSARQRTPTRLGQPPGGCTTGHPCICWWTPNRQCPPPPPLAVAPLTAVATPEGVRIIARDINGDFQAAIYYPNGAWSRWAIFDGTGVVDTASAVLMPDNTVQVFATGSDGVLQTRRQGTSGFWGSWSSIPGIIAGGPPSAIMAPDGTLQIVVRATDGFIYSAGETAPGSGSFNPWREITNYAEESSTDPTALAVPESNTWVIAYRNDIDAPRLRRHQPSAAGALDLSSGAYTFVDVPLLAPRP